jgi:hypothetical protein
LQIVPYANHLVSRRRAVEPQGARKSHSRKVRTMPKSVREFLRSDLGLLVMIATAKLLIHLLTNAFGGYGYFRDELYYLACAEHPDTGYVDHPPLSIYILMVNRALLGDSLFALRFLPAVAGAANVFLTGLIAREMGGGRFAQTSAAIASGIGLVALAVHTIFSMNAFDLLFWTLAFWVLVRIIRTEDARYWLLLGVVLGLGLLNKIDVLWLGAGLALGLLLTPLRSWLKTPWPYGAGTIAFIFFIPFILWNVMHDFAHIEFMRNASGGKYSGLSPLTFIGGQFLVNNPATVPLWILGLGGLFAARELRAYRVLGIVYAVALVVLLLNGHSKPEYLTPAYAPLFAAGGVMMERLGPGLAMRILRPAYLVLLVAGGLVLAPMTLPVLPVHTYMAYAKSLGIAPTTSENQRLEDLPQLYADMFGWEEKVAAVASVYAGLSAGEKSRCCLFGHNYGRSAAIDFFGPRYGLPKAIGRHNSYWIWGPRDCTGEVMIVLGGRLDDLRARFDSVQVAATVSSPYCMPYENNLPIYVCRKLKLPVGEVWRLSKNYD